MSQNFYIADMHIDHKNILSYDNRPFFDANDMLQTMIQNWNDRVTDDDSVYILGDMFWKNPSAVDILRQLNGNKYLIKGNHDDISDEIEKEFVWIKDYAEIKDNDRFIVLCHYPIPCFRNHYYGWYHLYGHVHSSFEYNMMEHIRAEMTALYDKPCNMYNVGCMLPYMDYTPRTLNEIIVANT